MYITFFRPFLKVVKEGRISQENQTLGRPDGGVFLFGASFVLGFEGKWDFI